MEFLKDRNKWSIALAAFFLTAVFATTLFLSTLEQSQFPPRRENTIGLYAGLISILITGSLAIGIAWKSRKEVMIYHEKENESFTQSASLLTVSSRGVHDASERNGTKNSSGQAKDLTTIYAEDGSIRYVSPAAESILGYRQNEMIGGSDLTNVHPDHRDSFAYIFTRLKDNPEESIKIQYSYKTKEGNYIWLESTGINSVSDPRINGYLFQTTDVTAQKLNDEATRMRGKIQALSENSPDLIVRLEEGRVTYINPVIEYYTGKSAVAFLNKKTIESGLDQSILDSWSGIVERVRESGGKMVVEMDFPSRLGKRVMQVHAIPEYDEWGLLESVLVVSHDITERKRIEVEARYQHKKITESISYARRIQSAILPNPRLVDRVLTDSFVLYKPRDVVSGDFPWFTQVKEDIFMAAIDCTGHGVPGALLSLVGYFLLNDIVRSRRVTEPGAILDMLDEAVATTLRPDEDAGTKDGMDICLCKINLHTKEVVYAGAHRPLYVVRSGILEEIKGNKFPIGGGIFKNQTNFTSTTLRLDQGDSIYFCSDGFCDQFGGPQGKKFGTRQLREIISKVHTMPMKEAKAVFNDEWERWKGNQKQTDDVLLIGVKF